MKAKVLKSFYPPTSPLDTSTVFGNKTFMPNKDPKSAIGVGQIIEVDAPIGGTIKEVYYKKIKLIVGTDVELILDKEVKSIDGFAPKTTKVKVLKEFFTGGVTGGIVNVGDIIMVGTPVNGKVYVNNIQTMKPIELIIGKDVELVKEEMTKEEKGGLLFYGALAILGYIVYRVLTTK
jgi:hypothetical protein